jgi:hypothetical protein
MYFRTWRRHRFIAPQEGAHASNHFTRAERLCHVVVRPEFQANNAVGFLTSGRQHEHRRSSEPVIAPQLAAHLESVETRQHQIYNDEVGWISTHFCKRDGTIGSVIDSKSFFFKIVFEQFDEIALVFDDQDLFCHDKYEMPQLAPKGT